MDIGLILSVLLLIIFNMCIHTFVVKQLFFLIPMKNKYNIFTTTHKYNLEAFLLIIALLLPSCILIYMQPFIPLIILYIINIIVSYNKYKKYNLLNFIDSFSKDMFDWDKIYELNIDSELKEQCFAIHGIDINDYKKTYLYHLNSEKEMIDRKINKLK